MARFLAGLFFGKNYNIQDNKTRAKYGTMCSIVGIIVNFLLSIFKLLAGFISASIAIMADAFNNLSDAGSSLITLISFKISSKPADRDHPFGHARMEYVCSMIVSFLILVVGSELMLSSLTNLFAPEGAEPTVLTPITVIILVGSVIMKFILGLFYRSAGKDIDSDVLRATATDCFSDVISTVAVLGSSILIHFTGWYFIDSIVGIAVSCLIFVAGGRILNDTKNALLGEAPIKEMVDGIQEIVAEYPDVIGIHDMMVHNYGPSTYFASFHAEVDGEADIFRLHDTIDNVERKIKYELGIACTIHMDPIVTNDEKTNELREFLLDAIKSVEVELSIHDFRTVVGETHTNLIFDVVVPFECKIPEQKIIEMISRAVSEKDENCYCVITVDRG